MSSRAPFVLSITVLGLVVAACEGGEPVSDASSDPLAKNAPARDKTLVADGCVPSPEVCDGLDNDCNGTADDELPGCDVCAPRHELPVVTHYSKALGRVERLAADQAEIYLPYDKSSPYAPGTCHPYYASGRMPDLDHYVGDTWSTTAISDDEATQRLRGLCETTSTPLRFLGPGAVGTPRLVPHAGAVQIVHALIVAGSLVTIVLPPNWSRTKQGGFPIVANGYYDLNQNVFREEGPELMRMIARSSSEGRTGAIGVLWNGGGAHASRTLSTRAREQFAAVIKRVADDFGGDPQRILMYGTSRGGGTALSMASNPAHHPYRVTFVAAAVPPTRIGEHAQLQSPTFPGLLGAVAWTTGLHDAWRTGWTFPSCAGRPHLTGMTAQEAHLYILTGTTDPTEADEHRSVISGDFIAGLKEAGTQVHLEVGSHDVIVPYAHQVEYGLKLIEAGVPVEAEVFLRSGHHSRRTAARTWEALQAYVDPSHAVERPTVTPGISFFRVNRASHSLEPLTPPDGVFPFTLEGPRFVALGNRFPLVMVGAPGTSWEVSLTTPGLAPYVWSGTIPETMRSIQWVDVPANQALGDYAYALRIQKPGAAWREIPNTSTIDGSAGAITLVAEEPNVGGSEIAALTLGATIPGFPQTTWGLSEY